MFFQTQTWGIEGASQLTQKEKCNKLVEIAFVDANGARKRAVFFGQT